MILVGEILGTADADIEDLLGDTFYCKLVSATYGLPSIDMSTFTSKNPRVVKRLEQHFTENGLNSGVLSHQAPADYLREHQSELAAMSNQSIQWAEQLVRRLNTLIS